MTPVEAAIEWLAALLPADRPRPLVPELRRSFGLTAVEACEAIREATLRQARAD